MAGDFDIVSVHTREIRGAGGIPVAEVEIVLENGAHGRACAPLHSASKEESHPENRNHVFSFEKFNSPKACELLREALLFEDSSDQRKTDRALTEMAGCCQTEIPFSGLITAASMSVAKAAAAGHRLPLYRYLGGIAPGKLPVPLVTMLHFSNKSEPNQSGEKRIHENGEVMVTPLNCSDYSEGFRRCCEVRQTLKKLLTMCSHNSAVSPSEPFHIETKDQEEASGYVTDAIRLSRNRPEIDIAVITSTTDQELFSPEQLPVAPFTIGHYLTVTAAHDALESAKSKGLRTALVTGPQQTEEIFAADFAAAFRCDYLKIENPDKLDQITKYNEILRLEDWMKHHYLQFS